MIIKSGYQTSVFLKCLGMCESSTCVYACVNHSSRFAEISSNPHKKSKFSPLLCCAKQKKEEEKSKLDSVYWDWENWRSMGEQSKKPIKAVVDGINKFFLSTLPFRWLDWII